MTKLIFGAVLAVAILCAQNQHRRSEIDLDQQVVTNTDRLDNVEYRLNELARQNLDNRLALAEQAISDIKHGLQETNGWLEKIAITLFVLAGNLIVWLGTRLWVFVERKPPGPEIRMP